MAEAHHSVVVTGIGAVSSLGRRIDTAWQALIEGRAAPATNRGALQVAVLAGYSPPPNLDREASELLGRCSLLAVDAAIQAVEDARLPFTAESAPLIGVVFGSEHGELDLPVAGAPASSVARVLGVAGPVLALAGPASGALAVAEAMELIRRGAAPVVVAGAADAFGPALLSRPLTDLRLSAAGRPFDSARDGVLPAEAGAALVLEDADLARERGARVYAEILGSGSAFSRATVMTPAGNHVDAARALQAALLRAEVYQGEIELVCASANGDPAGDEVEARALSEIWGPNVDRLTISSVHGALGHTFAAAGPLALVSALKAMETASVPPTAGLSRLDSVFHSLDVVHGSARNYRVATALINAFSAAANVSIVVRTT